MITRTEIRELADFESAQGCAVTFCYQPGTPQNQSHREEAILVKDLVRGVLHEIEKSGRNRCARADLDRILAVAEQLHGNSGKAKVIFAESSQNFWREYNLPPWLDGTRLFINRRFHLQPLAPLLQYRPRVCVCALDRTKARLFDYQSEQCKEVIGFFNELPRTPEIEGLGRYETGHVGRHLSELAKHHYKQVADTILKFFERRGCENLAVGIRDEIWPVFESVLHPYLKKNLVGRFAIDPTVDAQQIKSKVDHLLSEQNSSRRQELVRDVVGEAQRKGRGAAGLRHVLRSLEQGEVQVLLLGEHFHAAGVVCRHCGHIDFKTQVNCVVCSHPVTAVEDLADPILGSALRSGIEVVYVQDDPVLEASGHIAALLRFRADQNKAAQQAS